jgi:hypothetical protein
MRHGLWLAAELNLCADSQDNSIVRPTSQLRLAILRYQYRAENIRSSSAIMRLDSATTRPGEDNAAPRPQPTWSSVTRSGVSDPQ